MKYSIEALLSAASTTPLLYTNPTVVVPLSVLFSVMNTHWFKIFRLPLFIILELNSFLNSKLFNSFDVFRQIIRRGGGFKRRVFSREF